MNPGGPVVIQLFYSVNFDLGGFFDNSIIRGLI